MNRDKKYNERLFKDLHNPFEMDRRGFMKRFGGGLIVAFSVGEVNVACGRDPAADDKPGVNAYLRIAEDGRVTLYTGKIEMGQGPITSLPMELADELDVKLEDVDIVQGDTDLCPWDEGTYGSLSTRVFGQVLRAAAAKARSILLEMAAGELSVDVDQLDVRDGIVSSATDPSKSITYAELTRGKEILETSSAEVPLKKHTEFRIMGSSKRHVDAQDKVSGKALYTGDIKLPGMLCARILRPPSLGATLVKADTSEAEQMKGVRVVRDGDFIAVLHESQSIADMAITRVKATYEEERVEVNDESLYDSILQTATEAREMSKGGSMPEGEQAAGKHYEITYKDPYIAHAPIENHSATAMMENGRLKVWASCQTPYPTKDDIAEEVGMDPGDVHLLPVFVGGGFGGKIYNPQALEAAKLVKLTGEPIQLVYSRAEEFMLDRLRPAAVVKIKSGMDQQGNIVYWDYGIYLGGGRGARHFYDIPNHLTRSFSAPRGTRDHLFHTGAWRGPSNNTNTFARESQIEIMAADAGIDPLEFRLRHLKNYPKMANVLTKCAERFGWTPAKGPSGRGYGIAAGQDANTDVAVFVEVEVERKTGHVQVKRAVCCQDMGMVVNPQGAIIQAEGCMLMGLGYALREEIRFEGRKMLITNFDSYGITQFNMVPELDVVLIDAQDKDPQAGGEPAVICMGGAIANAIFDATGARLHRLPMTPERVLEAMNAG